MDIFHHVYLFALLSFFNSYYQSTGGSISERTVKQHLNVLKSLFRTTELNILTNNHMDNIKFTVKNYQIEDNYYDIKAINKMIFAIDSEPIGYQFAILFTLATGVRIGDLLALDESDFNYENLSMTGDFMPKRTLQDWFKRFLIRNDLKLITFHSLRHTSATLLLSNGIPLKNVAERLGHSRASTTSNIYAHAIPRIDKDAANVFSDILSTGSRDEKLKVVK